MHTGATQNHVSHTVLSYPCRVVRRQACSFQYDNFVSLEYPCQSQGRAVPWRRRDIIIRQPVPAPATPFSPSPLSFPALLACENPVVSRAQHRQVLTQQIPPIAQCLQAHQVSQPSPQLGLLLPPRSMSLPLVLFASIADLSCPILSTFCNKPPSTTLSGIL